MLLNEIFDTNNKVTWEKTKRGFEGAFDVDGEKYTIDVEEYSINLPSGEKAAIDVGFRKNGSAKLTADQKPARVLGSVLTGLKQKTDELSPNIVMFGALNENGFVEKRLNIYERAASLIRKTTKFDYMSKWFTFTGGKYMFVSDFVPTPEDMEQIEKLASYTK